MKYAIFIASLFIACQMPQKGAPTVTAITADGQIQFSDGSSKPIPHYDDRSYAIFYLVRHCEKAQDGTNNPDLTPEGYKRAERLGKIMDNARLDRIWSTNLKRTIKTAETVKRYAGDPLIGTFPPEMNIDWLMELLPTTGGQRHFYVGHQNTVPQILVTLTGSDQYKSIPENEYGMFYIAITKGVGQTEVLELKY